MKAKNKTYGKRIRAARAYLGMTQGQLAAELEITDQTLRNYEMGVTIPPVSIWDKLADMAPEVLKP